MVKSLFFSVMFFFCNNSFSQDSVKTKKRSIVPIVKQKGTQLAYLDITGFFAIATAPFDNTYAIRLTPTYAYYFSPKLEGLAEYSFTMVKLGSLAANKIDGYNQIAIALRFYPLKKYNIFYAELGSQLGTYTLFNQGGNLTLLKEWSNSNILGFGVEILSKKRKYMFGFNFRYVLPNSSRYESEYVKSFSTGFVLKK
jgi:hypothetical protein